MSKYTKFIPERGKPFCKKNQLEAGKQSKSFSCSLCKPFCKKNQLEAAVGQTARLRQGFANLSAKRISLRRYESGELRVLAGANLSAKRISLRRATAAGTNSDNICKPFCKKNQLEAALTPLENHYDKQANLSAKRISLRRSSAMGKVLTGLGKPFCKKNQLEAAVLGSGSAEKPKANLSAKRISLRRYKVDPSGAKPEYANLSAKRISLRRTFRYTLRPEKRRKPFCKKNQLEAESNRHRRNKQSSSKPFCKKNQLEADGA